MVRLSCGSYSGDANIRRSPALPEPNRDPPGTHTGSRRDLVHQPLHIRLRDQSRSSTLVRRESAQACINPRSQMQPMYISTKASISVYRAYSKCMNFNHVFNLLMRCCWIYRTLFKRTLDTSQLMSRVLLIEELVQESTICHDTRIEVIDTIRAPRQYLTLPFHWMFLNSHGDISHETSVCFS